MQPGSMKPQWAPRIRCSWLHAGRTCRWFHRESWVSQIQIFRDSDPQRKLDFLQQVIIIRKEEDMLPIYCYVWVDERSFWKFMSDEVAVAITASLKYQPLLAHQILPASVTMILYYTNQSWHQLNVFAFQIYALTKQEQLPEARKGHSLYNFLFQCVSTWKKKSLASELVWWLARISSMSIGLIPG